MLPCDRRLSLPYLPSRALVPRCSFCVEVKGSAIPLRDGRMDAHAPQTPCLSSIPRNIMYTRKVGSLTGLASDIAQKHVHRLRYQSPPSSGSHSFYDFASSCVRTSSIPLIYLVGVVLRLFLHPPSPSPYTAVVPSADVGPYPATLPALLHATQRKTACLSRSTRGQPICSAAARRGRALASHAASPRRLCGAQSKTWNTSIPPTPSATPMWQRLFPSRERGIAPENQQCCTRDNHSTPRCKMQLVSLGPGSTTGGACASSSPSSGPGAQAHPRRVTREVIQGGGYRSMTCAVLRTNF